VADLISLRRLAPGVVSATVATILGAGIHATAFAQGADTAQAAAGASDELTEVVVTAERRSEDLQTTPISIVAVSGDQLEAAAVRGLNDLALIAPSVEINRSGLNDIVNIRGVGNSVTNPAVSAGVAVIFDGLIQGETDGLFAPLYDIADTEILRGPQGTFVGDSAIGGALIVNSRNPTLDGNLNGYVQGLLGDYADTKVTGAVNLPVSDTFAARIAFNFERRDSFYSDVGTQLNPGTTETRQDPGHVDDQNVRVSLLWKPADAFQALLKVSVDRSDTGGFPAKANPNVPADSPYYQYSSPQPFNLNFNTPEYDNETLDRVSLELKYTWANGLTLRSQSGVQRLNGDYTQDYDASSYNGVQKYLIIGPDDDSYTQEFDLLSPTTGPLTWIGGLWAFYRHTPTQTETVTEATYNTGLQSLECVGYPGPCAISTQYQEGILSVARDYGVFGQVSYQILPTLQAQAGIRENWDANYARGVTNTYVAPVVTPPAVQPLGNLTGVSGKNTSFEDRVPTAKVGLNWTPTQGQLIYAFFARGYKAGGANGDGTTFNPEHANDSEIGWKDRLFGGHLETQIGAYYTAEQAFQQVILTPTAGKSDIINLGTMTAKGIEASAQARAMGFDLSVSVTYESTGLSGGGSVIAAYLLPDLGNGTLGPQCNGANGPKCFNYAPFTESVGAAADPFAPKFSANVALDYGIPLGGNILRPRVTYSDTQKQYTQIFQNNAFYLMGVRNIWDASLSFEAGKWVSEAYVNNLSNEVYLQGIGQGNNVYYGNPRQMGLRVERKF
jgi:iron complex outermembrane receptor protein